MDNPTPLMLGELLEKAIAARDAATKLVTDITDQIQLSTFIYHNRSILRDPVKLQLRPDRRKQARA
jgi:hypothetical protein